MKPGIYIYIKYINYETRETNCVIHWIDSYPVDSAIQRFNIRGLIFFSCPAIPFHPTCFVWLTSQTSSGSSTTRSRAVILTCFEKMCLSCLDIYSPGYTQRGLNTKTKLLPQNSSHLQNSPLSLFGEKLRSSFPKEKIPSPPPPSPAPSQKKESSPVW